MAGMTEQEYRDMVESSDIDTRLAELRDREGRLVAVCLLDWLSDGPSAVYSFFDPHETRRSLGTFVVLSLIEAAKQAQETGRASCRDRVWKYGNTSVVRGSFKTKQSPIQKTK